LRDWFGSLIQDKADKSGLIYMRNRYYDPATGKFTQEDPIGLAGGLNLYGFAGGDPINFSDPFGLAADSLFVVDQHGNLDPEYERELDELAQENPDVKDNLGALRNSSKNYLLVSDPDFQGGLAWGGESPVGLGSEQPFVDGLVAELGWSDRNIVGIATVGAVNSASRALVGGHELVHLRGIDDRGLRYGHFDPQFDADYRRMKMHWDYRKPR